MYIYIYIYSLFNNSLVNQCQKYMFPVNKPFLTLVCNQPMALYFTNDVCFQFTGCTCQFTQPWKLIDIGKSSVKNADKTYTCGVTTHGDSHISLKCILK